jgi:GTP-binding protein Era
MMSFAYSAMEEADIILLLLDVNDVNFDDKDAYSETFAALKKLGKPVMLVVNKTDLVTKEKTAMTIAFFSDKFGFAEVHPVSALKQSGVQELLNSVNAYLPCHPPFYPPDMVSEHPERFFVSEIIREKIFEKFREEIPYSTTVDIVDFKEKAGRKDVINAEIYVERDSQKGILIGRQGKALKEIGEAARKDIETFLDRPVFLELHVRVGDKWRSSETWLKKLGYRS